MKSSLSCVIAEDEEAARKVLIAYINKYCPHVKILAEAKDGKEAVELILDHQPQLVFLDVEMPYGNAFDVLEKTKMLSFQTIFVTAYSDYAIQALNLNAAYYLLKPLSIDGLIDAVKKVSEEINSKSPIDKNQILLENQKEKQSYKKKVVLPTLNGFDVIHMNQIVRLKGNGNFTDIHLVDGQKKMVCRFLKHYEDLLPRPFIRIHKSHIINLDHLVSYQKGKKSYVTLKDHSEIEISATYKGQFLKELV